MIKRMGAICAISLGLVMSACGQAAEEPSAALDLAAYDMVDLTHAYDDTTIYWPSAPSGFELHEDAYGHVEGGWFYSSYSIATPEHGGTHMDAPIHFDEHGQTVDQIPLQRLIGPAVIVDVSAKAALDPDYLMQPGDIEAFEADHGRIEPGSVVLLNTGWAARWPDRLAYLGDDRPGRTDDLHFPSFGEDAVRILIDDRQVIMIGVDTASIDNGQSQDFRVHQVAGAANVPGLENLTNLNQLPAKGAVLIALPMKIGGGSGGPVRVVALIPR